MTTEPLGMENMTKKFNIERQTRFLFRDRRSRSSGSLPDLMSRAIEGLSWGGFVRFWGFDGEIECTQLTHFRSGFPPCLEG